MDIDGAVHDDVLILTVNAARIDAASCVAFKERVRALVSGSQGRVMIDLGQVEFLDSSGLGALVAIMKMLGGRRLELAACGVAIRKVLSLTRMDKVFTLHDAAPPGRPGPDRTAA